MHRFPLILATLASLALRAQGPVSGQVTDGQRAVAGVRVFVDEGIRTDQDRNALMPALRGYSWDITGSDGRFSLLGSAEDTHPVLIFEKEGWARDMVHMRNGEAATIVLRPANQYRVEKVLVVRLDFADEAVTMPDDDLRRLLFNRKPGQASAANFLYEVSKGNLALEEGAILHFTDPQHTKPRNDDQRAGMVRFVLEKLKGQDLHDFDRVDNRTGAMKPDGKPDHLWIFAPGEPKSITNNDAHLRPVTFMMPLPWNPSSTWPVVFMTEQAPLGNIVHESFHAMGEHAVDDLYLGCEDPNTAGIWDLMDAGQYRGWDAAHGDTGPWQQDTGYSPSHPGPWVIGELWYRGRFGSLVKKERIKGRAWDGWLAPLERAPGIDSQRLVVPDPRKAGAFWEFSVRRPWGFNRGRVGNRWGPGFEGLIVEHIDPSLLSREGEPKGPVRIMDAHPRSPEPPQPRFPCGRWELDDAAYNLGPGETAKGSDGPVSWEVISVDSFGSMRIQVNLRIQ
ncbi:MAG: hypothetical protein IPQ13_06475 [Holophagaceae bacterium]|nr:hypothetical protein [Holophagaceae bacterium]